MVWIICCVIKQEIYLSEDYSFCERVYENGEDVWINIDLNLSHIICILVILKIMLLVKL